MKYRKQYRDGSKAFEVTKEEARKTLNGYWKDEFLDDVFENEKSFRLYTPYAYVSTMTDDGMVPMAGFYGVCE